MKRLSMFLLLVPAFLLSQEQTTKRDTTLNKEKAVNNQVVFTNDGKLKFPDNTVQETAYPGNSQSQGNPPNFDILNNGIQFPDGTVQTTAYIPINNPPLIEGPLVIVIEGIVDALMIGSVKEEVDITIDVESGGSPSNSRPSFGDVSFTREADGNSALLKGFLPEVREIDFIEVYKQIQIGGNPDTWQPIQKFRYTGCFLTQFSLSNSNDNFFTQETVSFTFRTVCTVSYKQDLNGGWMEDTSSSYDRVTGQSGGNCSF
ncbi:MAG: hypothetical protein HKN68_02865 [Saprospiraceae bacterium]|nr:hypothetical protein [Saprospiraceae bacterium]